MGLSCRHKEINSSFSDYDLNVLCNDDCEAKTLDCIIDCENDTSCMSICIQNGTACSESKSLVH